MEYSLIVQKQIIKLRFKFEILIKNLAIIVDKIEFRQING